MDIVVSILSLAAFVLLTASTGLFVAVEFAMTGLERSTIEADLKERGDATAHAVVRDHGNLSFTLSGAQLGITVTTLAAGFLAEPVLGKFFTPLLELIGLGANASQTVAVILALIVATLLSMVFGELVPKNFAIALPLRTARAVQGFMRGFTRVTRPLIAFLNGAANKFLRRIGIEPTEELASARSPQELSFLVTRSVDQGTLDEATANLVRRSLLFGDRRAHEVMTPRSQLDFISPDERLTQVVDRIHDSGHARFPVLDARTDEVLGLITTAQVLQVPVDMRSRRTVADVMLPPTLVPSSVDLDTLLEMLRDGPHQLGVVIDEFGSVDGVVTLEDLVEEITGELDDEHDQPSAPRELTTGTWELSGLLRIDEVRDTIGLSLPESDDYDTLAGLVLFRLERMAEPGDEVELDGYDREHRTRPVTLGVVDLEGVRIDTVRVSVGDPVEPDETEGER